ncbi:MAG: S24/S26 family peptidase [Clostridia bacterium]|nr:S24/S26 family peptidase [Clostridia bacterium]
MTYNLSIKTLDAYQDGEYLLELLDSGAVIPLIVTGSSMLPFLKDGRDTVLLQKVDKFKKGQILFFRRRNGLFVLHRIRKIRSDGRILVNGDAQNWCEIVLPEQAAAVVIGFVRDGKTRNAGSFPIRLRDTLWYPTRPIRPLIFRIVSLLRRLFPRKG